MFRNVPELVLYGVLSLGIYFKLWRSYFTQDEWYYFTLFHRYTDSAWGFVSVFIDQFRNISDWGIHVTPLWNSLFFLEYQIFGLTYQYWALLAIFLHICSAWSVSAFVRHLTKSDVLALVGGTFFVIQSSHTEAVTWANTNVQTQIPLILVCWSLVFWLDWAQKGKRVSAFMSLFLLFFSLSIRENVLGIVVLLPFITYIYGNIRRLKQSIVVAASSCSVYVLFRFGFIRVLAAGGGETVSQSIPTGVLDIGAFLFRLPFYTVKTLIHQFVGSDAIRWLSELFTVLNYPSSYGADRATSGPVYGAFVNSAGADTIMILLAIPFFGALCFLWNYARRRQPRFAKSIPFAILFIGASLSSWVLLVPHLLTLMPSMTFVPSRQLYFASIGTAFIAALVVSFLRQGVLKFTGTGRTLCIGGLLLVLFWFGREYVSARHIVVSEVIDIGEQRRVITDYTKAVYPTIADKAIFYITSNKQYFGFPAYTVPFQTNFGATLLEMYRKGKNYSPFFYERQHFIDKGPLGQGYIEENGKGFGYYYEGRSLLADMDTYSISSGDIVAFHYDGSSRVFQVTTEEIRSRIEKEKAYVRLSEHWTEFGKGVYPVWFLVSPAILVTVDETDEKTQFIFVSAQSGVAQYIVSVFKNTGQVQMDEFIEEATGGTYIQRTDTTIYVDKLRAIRGTIVKGADSDTYFFRHPTAYSIVSVDGKAPEYPDDLFLWSMRLE